MGVAVGVSDMWQVKGDMRHWTHDMRHMTRDTWLYIYYIDANKHTNQEIQCLLYAGFLDVFKQLCKCLSYSLSTPEPVKSVQFSGMY